MIQHPVVPMTRQELENRSVPGAVPGGNLEVYADMIYDTALYTSAATTQIEFFTTTRANRQLSNLSPAGALPSPQFFLLYGIHIDYGVDPAPTAWQDVWQLMYGAAAVVALTGMPTARFIYADKEYGPWPLSALHGTGALTGFGTANNLNYANPAMPDGGLFQGGGLLLSPNQNFRLVLEWAAPVTLNRGNTQIRVTLSGSKYRAIT